MFITWVLGWLLCVINVYYLGVRMVTMCHNVQYLGVKMVAMRHQSLIPGWDGHHVSSMFNTYVVGWSPCVINV